MALAPLAGCLPYNPIWPDGVYVHPQYVEANDPGPCVVGLAWGYTEKIYTITDYYYNHTEDLEFWFSFGQGLANETVDTADCWRVFAYPFAPPRRVFWTCNINRFGLTELPWWLDDQNPNDLASWRLCSTCQSTGDAVYLGPWPCNTGPITV
jgi:hypothetical protein